MFVVCKGRLFGFLWFWLGWVWCDAVCPHLWWLCRFISSIHPSVHPSTFHQPTNHPHTHSAARDAYALKNALDKLSWAIDALSPHVDRCLFHTAAGGNCNGSIGGRGGDAAGVSLSSPSLAFDQVGR